MISIIRVTENDKPTFHVKPNNDNYDWIQISDKKWRWYLKNPEARTPRMDRYFSFYKDKAPYNPDLHRGRLNIWLNENGFNLQSY